MSVAQGPGIGSHLRTSPTAVSQKKERGTGRSHRGHGTCKGREYKQCGAGWRLAWGCGAGSGRSGWTVQVRGARGKLTREDGDGLRGDGSESDVEC